MDRKIAVRMFCLLFACFYGWLAYRYFGYALESEVTDLDSKPIKEKDENHNVDNGA